MPFLYDLKLAAGEPERMFVQQLVPAGSLVGTGQAVCTLTDGTMEWHVPAPKQGLLVAWFSRQATEVAGGDVLARIVCEGEQEDVPDAAPVRLG